ncbi:MAG TPA: hypothetical protein VGW33_14760 [Terriglobia bacterium]|nr:hypothetical protein [Terriglobia bacterium]
MAIDDVPQSNRTVEVHENHGSGAWIGVFVVLALLVIGEIYSLARIGSLNGALTEQQTQVQKQVQQATDQMAANFSKLQDASTQQLDELRNELDTASKQMGSTEGRALGRARSMVAKLQKQQQAASDELKQEIAKKADDEKVGALSQDVDSTKSDLSSTKKTVDTLASDLGMARSEMGTLIARNHDDIETLRKLGERNYYEFTLTKNQRQTIASVGMTLKKTNVKHHTFNLDMLADDSLIAKKNRAMDEPIFFAPSNSKSFYEVVINKVTPTQVTGYISTPKFAGQEMASASSDTTK